MELRSISPREPKGRSVTLDGIEYVFSPDGNGNNVCDVKNAAHADLLLSIVEGYEPHDETERAKVQQARARAEEAARKAEEAKGPLAGTTAVDEDDEVDTGVEGGEEESRDDLIAKYVGFYGRNPHPAMTEETLKTKIAEAQAALEKQAAAEKKKADAKKAA